MSKCFTTLGSDGHHYCFCISHEDTGDYLEVHKRSREGTSTFDEKSFVTRIPIKTILQFA
jgi:hypothetical protein